MRAATDATAMIDFLAIAFSLPNALLNLGKPVSFQRDRLRAVFLYVARYLPLRTRASLRRSAVNAIPAPMTMRANVALKLPGAMQLMQVPTIVGVSYTVPPFLEILPTRWCPIRGSQSAMSSASSIPPARIRIGASGSWHAIASASSRVPIRAPGSPSFADVQPIAIGSGLPFLGSGCGKLGRVLGRHVLQTCEHAR